MSTAQGLFPGGGDRRVTHVDSVVDAGDILRMLLSVPSPTGHERPLAEEIGRWADDHGLPHRVDLGGGEAASVVITVPGTSPATSRSTLIYAPIDTLDGDDPSRLAPWFGSVESRARWIRPQEIDDWVTGEGAENPKGYAAAALAAAVVLNATRRNRGDVRIALCGGSVPSLGVADHTTMGLGSGLLRLLQRGLYADGAVACKPGWFIATEEPGVVWIRISLSARGAYVGARHTVDYRNVITTAARLAAILESWLHDYAVLERSQTVFPQGAVTGIHAGIPQLAAFVGQTAELLVDLRVAPGRTIADVVTRVQNTVAGILDDDQLDWALDSVAAVPPSRTPGDHPIVSAARAAWRDMEGTSAPSPSALSGASDANLLRAWGIPTVRVGFELPVPGQDVPTDDFGLNVVSVASCEWLAGLLTRTAVHFGNPTEQGS